MERQVCWIAPEWMIRVSLVACCLVISTPIVMSTLAPYDDQGYVMMTLQSFHEGSRLYGETHTQYGPAYYLLSDSLHFVLGIPLTQDGVRWKTIAMWSLCTLVCYGILRRCSVSMVLSFATSILFHLHLEKLALEPGHPQEWILLLSLLSLWLMAGPSKIRWVMAAMLIGLIGMMKVNCGAVLATALFVQSFVDSRREIKGEKGAWLQVILGGAASTFLVIFITLSTGVTFPELQWGLIQQHQRFTSEFFHPIPWAMEGLAIALASLGLLIACRQGVQNESLSWAVFGLVLIGAAGAVFAMLCDAGRPLFHGLETRGAAAWLVICGPALVPWLLIGKRSSRIDWYLGALVCLAPAIAFPTPGTQLSLATCYSWLVIGRLVPLTISWTKSHRPSSLSLRIDRTCVVVSLISLIACAFPAWFRWLSNEPTQLSGSVWLRLDTSTTLRERSIVDAIQSTNCQYLMFDGHNHNRFFFWTNTKPLTAANPTFWPRLLSASEIQSIEERIQQTDRVCVVIPPECDQLAGDFAIRLRRLLKMGWVQTDQIDGWLIGVRHADQKTTNAVALLPKVDRFD